MKSYNIMFQHMFIFSSLATLVACSSSSDSGDGRSIDEHPTVAISAISAADDTTCALLEDGQLRCWGDGGYGVTGSTSYDNYYIATKAIDFGEGRTVTAVSSFYEHACAVLDNGTVKCWGYDANGELGQGWTGDYLGDESAEIATIDSVDLGTDVTATAVATGYAHSCALLSDGAVKCWGEGDYGAIGTGSNNDVDSTEEMGDNLLAIDLGTDRTAIAITAGGYHTCAILDDHSVKCWGYNSDGALGINTDDDVGSASNQMGDNLSAVNLGENRTALALTAGSEHTCALLDNHTAKCWGYNDDGQLGQGNSSNYGDTNTGDYTMENLNPIMFADNMLVAKLSAGEYFTCAILVEDASETSGKVKCWGENDYGQLGLGDTSNRGDDDDMSDLPYVDLGTDRLAIDITTGSNHACALLDDGNMVCWGNGSNGALGVGTDGTIGDAANEMGDNLESVIFEVD